MGFIVRGLGWDADEEVMSRWIAVFVGGRVVGVLSLLRSFPSFFYVFKQ